MTVFIIAAVATFLAVLSVWLLLTPVELWEPRIFYAVELWGPVAAFLIAGLAIREHVFFWFVALSLGCCIVLGLMASRGDSASGKPNSAAHRYRVPGSAPREH